MTDKPPPTSAASAFTAAVCRWHHAHNGQPVPCVQADREASALTGLLEHAGYRLTAARAVEQPTTTGVTEDDLRYLLWWQILRPDRLGIARAIDRAAHRYNRASSRDAADALEQIAEWLRSTAGEVADQAASDEQLTAARRLLERDPTAIADPAR